ncbi:MAG TPA: hypothetical protein VEC02_00955 [Nitrososphaerales archaeon]|nr:hypothetical protein [Nitrososphaerales archaeon]
MSEDATSAQTDQMRIKYGYYIVIAGFLLVGLAFAASLLKFTMAADVSSVFGLITGVVGTLVGAFFGVQVGSQGKESAANAQKKAENAQHRAEKYVSHLAAIGGEKAKGELERLDKLDNKTLGIA